MISASAVVTRFIGEIFLMGEINIVFEYHTLELCPGTEWVQMRGMPAVTWMISELFLKKSKRHLTGML